MSEAHRRVWIAHIAKLVYPVDPPRAAAKIAEYLPYLADLPDEAFGPNSAEAVAMSDRRMALPSLDEIAKPLRAWWKENRPRPLSLPAVQVSSMPEQPTPEQVAERCRQSDEILRKHGYVALADRLQGTVA